MIQATRTATRKGRQKKKQQAQLQQAQLQQNNHHSHGASLPRKSVRYGGYNRAGKKSQPNSPSPYHHNHFASKRNKRKSVVFRPTHHGQSAVAMVEHSVFQQINNPTLSAQIKYQQYKHKRRQSVTAARKKKGKDMIRKTVAMNAHQHQQMLAMVKQQTLESPEPTHIPSSPPPHIHNDGLPPPNNDSWIDRAKSHRMAPHKINTNIENKSRVGSSAVTPINKNAFMRSKSSRGTSMGDALGLSKKELDEYKSQITNNDKRNSMSFMSQQSLNVHNQNTSNIQANQLFTTPHSVASRRQSLLRPVTNNNNAVIQMILMVFQSLPSQQKKELMHLMSLQLMQQSVPNVAALAQQQNKSNLPKALSNATNKANFLEQLKEPLKESKSIPIKESPTAAAGNKSTFSQVARVHTDRGSRSANTTPKLRAQTPLLKVRYESTPKLMLDNDHDELCEIKEADSMNLELEHNNQNSSNRNVSWKPTTNIKLPTGTPQIGGALTTVQSEYDFDNVSNPLTPKSTASEEDEDKESMYIDAQLSHDIDIYHNIELLAPDKKAKSYSKKMVHFKEETEELTHTESVSKDVMQSAMEIMQPLFEQELEEEKKQILRSKDIGMTPLLHNQHSINSMQNNYLADRDDSAPPSPTKTPIMAPTKMTDKKSTSASSPITDRKELLLTHRLSKIAKDISFDEPGANDEEPHERMSSADLFAKDIIGVMYEEDIGNNANSTDRTQSPLHILDSSDDNGEVSENNSSSRTEEQDPEHFTVKLQDQRNKLHPSQYQQNKLRLEDPVSANSAESAGSDHHGNIEDSTQRIGVPAPLQSKAMMHASMMDIGIDPDGGDGESDDEAPHYFGAGTPIAVREGTETIQKTLRAVWVRGHTRIGTVIHFLLIVINCVAAVMFVAAIEGYENDGLEYFFTSAFLVDLCVRLYAAKSAFLYLRSAKGIADFVSVMPGIILAISDFDASVPLWTFSFVRAMRVLRILRLLAHMVNVEDVQQEELHDPIDIDAREFMDQLTGDEKPENTGCCTKKFWIMSKVTYFKLTLVSYLLMVVFVGAGLFACVEGPQSETVTVDSFFHSFYFIVVTITTVGYGDLSPETPIGQICIILVISVAFIVVPYRASVLAELEFKFADQESELSIMDAIDLDDLRADAESDYDSEEGPESFLGYCANCAGPRWTIGTQEMPISCMHCFHPVLTPDQVQEWFPDIAAALAEFVTNEQNALLSLMLDAKEGADNGMLEVFQEMVRNHNNPNIPFLNSQPGSMHAAGNPFGSAYATPSVIDAHQMSQYPSIDPQLLMGAAVEAHAFNRNMSAITAVRSTETVGTVDGDASISKLSHDQSHMHVYDNKHLNLLKNERVVSVDPIAEEPIGAQMESPIDLSDNKHKKYSDINTLNLLSTFPHTVGHGDEHENEAAAKNKLKLNLRVISTPSMEESETLSGYGNAPQFNSNSNSNSEQESAESDAENYDTPQPNMNEALFKPDIEMPTPIKSQSHHSRQPTPAEFPGVQPIKKFSLKLLDNDIKAFNEEDAYEDEEETDELKTDDSFNDSVDKAAESETARHPRTRHKKAKSYGGALKKNNKKKVKKKSETPKAVSTTNNKSEYHYNNLAVNGSSSDDEDVRNDKVSTPRFALSIIVDEQRPRAATSRRAVKSTRRAFDDDMEFEEDEEMNPIAPQDYQDMNLLFGKLDKRDKAKEKLKRASTKNNIMDDNDRQKRWKSSRRHAENDKNNKSSRHVAHKSAHLHAKYNSGDQSVDVSDLQSAFIQNQTAAKSMTNLLLATQMQQTGNLNLKEYHSNNVLAQLVNNASNKPTFTPSFSNNNNGNSKKGKKKKGRKKKKKKS